MDHLAAVVMVAKHHLLVHLDGTVGDLSDSDTAHELVVVNGGDQHLGRCIRVPLRTGDMLDDGIQQRLHIRAGSLGIHGSHSASCGGEYKGAVDLLIGSSQVHQKLQDLVHHLIRSCLRAVDLIDADHHRQGKLHGLAQHELCLGHGALKGVHKQYHAIHHLQDTLYLAAEVRMARGVHDIDLISVIIDRCIL